MTLKGGIGTDSYGASSGNEVVRVIAPAGAAASWDNAITGAFKIRLPQRAYNTMWRMVVKIYDYYGSVSEYQIGNYSYSTGAYQSAAFFIGSGTAEERPVRIGNDGSYDCVWIGETNTVWSHPTIAVTEFVGGFRGGTTAAWGNNWDISYVTSFGSWTLVGTAARLATSPTVNGNAIWHAGNDGAGSTLDADLLDGQQGSYYAAASSLGSYLPLTGGTLSGPLSTPYFGINNTTNTNGYGISLYNGAVAGEPTYGMMFQGTGTFGTYGSVYSANDWATYFTMNNTPGRGWIFRNVGVGNVAAISNGGEMTLGSHLEIGNNFGIPNVEWSASSGSTGMVIFYLPGDTNNYGMVHMVFDIYEYDSPRVATVIIGGHNWSNSWYNIGCNVIGYTDKQVRLGFKDGRFVVVFGNSGSTWNYGTIRPGGGSEDGPDPLQGGYTTLGINWLGNYYDLSLKTRTDFNNGVTGFTFAPMNAPSANLFQGELGWPQYPRGQQKPLDNALVGPRTPIFFSRMYKGGSGSKAFSTYTLWIQSDKTKRVSINSFNLGFGWNY